MAALNRSWGWAGYEIGDRIATFWGNRNFLEESRSLKKKDKKSFVSEIPYSLLTNLMILRVLKNVCTV